MGYTAQVLLATILFAPGVLIVAALLLLLARKLGLVPRGSGAILGYALIVCASYGVLYLGITVDMLAVTPARLQARYLGSVAAGPLSLVHFEQGGAFQDPSSEWRYRLSSAQAEALRRRCRWQALPDGRRFCVLHADMDERWYAEVSLDGDELRMIDGLH